MLKYELSIPYNDSLVIWATMVNYDKALVFMDAGSSVNILFWVDLEHMIIKARDLQYITVLLFEFLGHVVQQLSQIKLPLSLGKEPHCRIILTTYTYSPSSYNIILRRLSLSAFQVVASPYYQKIKCAIEKKWKKFMGTNKLLANIIQR